MKQEDIDLLLTYLSMTLPYGVKLKKYNEDNSVVELYSINLEHKAIQYWSYKGGSLQIGGYGHLIRRDKLQFKPYLRPLSSMTDEEKMEFDNFCVIDELVWKGNSDIGYKNQVIIMSNAIIWLLKKHFDFMDLIAKGLALEASEENEDVVYASKVNS